MFFWVRNITPASIVRFSGPVSNIFLNSVVSNRTQSIGKEEEIVLKSYLEQITLLPGSGEYGIAYILYPGA